MAPVFEIERVCSLTVLAEISRAQAELLRDRVDQPAKSVRLVGLLQNSCLWRYKKHMLYLELPWLLIFPWPNAASQSNMLQLVTRDRLSHLLLVYHGVGSTGSEGFSVFYKVEAKLLGKAWLPLCQREQCKRIHLIDQTKQNLT